VTALIDNGSHLVFIDDRLVEKLGLRRRQLLSPQRARLVMGEEEVMFSEWVKLRTSSEDQRWTARVVWAIVALKLTFPVILGGPFLRLNKIVVNHKFGKVTAKDAQFQLIPQIQDPQVLAELEDMPTSQDKKKAFQDMFKELQE